MIDVDLFVDEVRGQKKSFLIQTGIGGSPSACQALRTEIYKCIHGNPKLGSSFKGFHASELTLKNWSTKGSAAGEVLRIFLNSVK